MPLFTQGGWVAVRSRLKPVDECAIETLIDVVASITNTLGERKHAFSATSAPLTVSTKSRLSLLACKHRASTRMKSLQDTNTRESNHTSIRWYRVGFQVKEGLSRCSLILLVRGGHGECTARYNFNYVRAQRQTDF